jgi:hypothetical protein
MNKNWTPENLAWVAGLLEGEGCFSTSKRTKTGGGYQLSITCNMTDEDVLIRLHNILGVGSVRGPYKKGKEHHKPQWCFTIRRMEDAKEVMLAIRPWMLSRRQARIDELLALEEARALSIKKTHCKNGHEYTEENTYMWNNIRYCKKCRAAANDRRRQQEVTPNGTS